MEDGGAYQETFTSKYRHITHSFGYLLIYNGTCFMVATVCHHVCIARIITRSVNLAEKVLGQYFLPRQSSKWRIIADISWHFSEIWKELDSKSRGRHSRGRGGRLTRSGQSGGGAFPREGADARENTVYGEGYLVYSNTVLS